MHPGRLVLALAALLLTMPVGCRQESSPADQRAAEAPGSPALTAYGRDVDRICNSEERSGAAQRRESERAMIVAQWLGGNLETAEGRSLMVEISRSSPADKVAALERESAAVGLPACPLARAWAAGLGD